MTLSIYKELLKFPIYFIKSVLIAYIEKVNRVHEHENSSGCAIVFAIIILHNSPLIKEVWYLIIIVCLLIMRSEGIDRYRCLCFWAQLSFINENKVNAISGIDTYTRVKILFIEHGKSCWNIINWTRFIFSMYVFLQSFALHCRERIEHRHLRTFGFPGIIISHRVQLGNV